MCVWGRGAVNTDRIASGKAERAAPPTCDRGQFDGSFGRFALLCERKTTTAEVNVRA